MAATDLLVEVGDPGSATTLDANYTINDSTVTVVSTTNWPSVGKAVIFAIDEATIVDGEEVQTAGTYNEFEGTVASATSISNVNWKRGSGDRNYTAGSLTRVYIPVSAERENRIVEWGIVEHDQDGTHGNITTGTIAASGVITASSHIDVNDSSTAIRDSSDNELVKFSKTASAVNEFTIANATTGNGPELQATGTDSNIDVEIVPKGAGNVTKNTNPIDWWEEIGRTTLSVSGDTITVSSLPARKYLRILVNLLATGGTINFNMTLNNDTANNYSYRRSLNGAADATTTSAALIPIGNATASTPTYGVIDIINNSANEKLVTGFNNQQGTAGAANLVDRVEIAAKWANTSAQISRVDWTNTGTGNYDAGSEVVVLGHD